VNETLTRELERLKEESRELHRLESLQDEVGTLKEELQLKDDELKHLNSQL